MLSDKLREGAQGRIFKIIFWVIILSFVFTGVGGYLIPRLNTDPVKVGDYSISAAEWSNQYNRQTRQMYYLYGSQFSSQLEDPVFVQALRARVLEDLIDNVAFSTAVFDTDVRIGDEQVRDVIRRSPAFQKDGQFDNELYLASVRNMGMDPEYYGEQLRTSLTSQFIMEPVLTLSAAIMPYEVKLLGDILFEERVIDLYTLDPKELQNDIVVSDDEIKSYYDNNHQQFMAPASVDLTYLVLDTNELKTRIVPEEQEIADFYALNNQDFRVEERRDVSQILLKESSDLEKRAAMIENALASGEDFANLASQYSDDESSKDLGGRIGLVGHNEIAANLEEAVFNLHKVGDVTPPIKDNYGIHFFKLNDIAESYIPELNEIYDTVRQRFIDNRAAELYRDQLITLSDLTYENPDSLDLAAAELNLTVKSFVNLKEGDEDAPWPLNSHAFQEAAFDQNNITSGLNTNVVAISDSVSAVMNISNFEERTLLPFDTVEVEVKDKLMASRAAALGNEILENYAKSLKSNPYAEAPQGVETYRNFRINRGTANISPLFSLAVFAIPAVPMEYAVSENEGKVSLAVLKEAHPMTDAGAEQYSALVRAQLPNQRREETLAALYRKSRNLTEIEYNQEAIDLINQTSAD